MDVLTTGQVAKICRVAPRTVAKWFDKGQLRGYRIPGSKDRRIPLGQLIRFMQAHGIPLEGLDGGQVRVLLVDEEHEFATLLRDTLNKDGRYVAAIASTIFEAGVVTQTVRPHVIVADISLPGLQPKKLCQYLRSTEEFHQIKLVAVGGALTEGQDASHVQIGFDACLHKPFEIRQLTALIDKVNSKDQ
ncbi:MAG: response regulator [bacterium]|nr:response regulator [bacterium]